ncbi:acetokinase family protein [Burkholderia pseudomallei MSHR332]|nr:acetokinase family protein [Burkholderia pseudomallei MSHR332]
MSEPLLLTFNAGSSTLKIGLYSVANGEPAPLGRGKIDFNRAPLQFEYANGGEAHAVPLAAPVTDDLHAVLDEALGWIDAHLSVHELVSVGHRVVHGGDTFDGRCASTSARSTRSRRSCRSRRCISRRACG